MAMEVNADPDDNYFRTDEFEDVINSLELVELLSRDVNGHPQRWKWIVIAVHNALQGACICLLTNTAGTGALNGKSTERLLERLNEDWDGDAPWPDEFVAPFGELLKRLPDDLEIILPNSLELDAGFGLVADMNRLRYLRNNFLHFSPKSWLIELAGLPRIIGHAIDLSERISGSNKFQRVNRFRDLPVSALCNQIRDNIGVAV